MQINVVSKEKLEFCDLSLGDTFFVGDNLYLRVDEIIDEDGDAINAYCLDDYFACHFYPHDSIEKCDCVLTVRR